MSDNTRILYLFTRTPLHVGAGASVGAIDQPIQRERHTGFPIIPGSSMKGVFADCWTETLVFDSKRQRLRGCDTDASWLFGSDDARESAAGALQFSEAKLLAFPIRSAKGGFAWITSPLILRRAARDGVLPLAAIEALPEPTGDHRALFSEHGPLAIAGVNQRSQIVLEDYTFEFSASPDQSIGAALASLMVADPVWKEISSRLVIVTDGMMSFFARTACEVAQHVRISDATGTAVGGALFNQENVPSETLFYSALRLFGGNGTHQGRTPQEAAEAFEKMHNKRGVYQFGGDASTGLGLCSVQVVKPLLS